MSKPFVFLLMIFCHIVDDYRLQGILSQMKQRAWWQENAPQPLYRYDYLIALFMHSFSWAFMISLPIAVFYHFQLSNFFLGCFVVNCIVHAVIDHAKANLGKINLITDQLLHLVQICVTYWILM